MKGLVVILLLSSVFRRASLAGPVNRPQVTSQTSMQPDMGGRGLLYETQNERRSGFSRLRRAVPVVPKPPVRICDGCFSVIGDPMIPQQ